MDSTSETRVQRSEDLVVIGASAGGIEALSTFVGTLPDTFPAPIVIAQHLDPSRQSSLDVILQHNTKLSVEVVSSGAALKPGTIYVIAANRHVIIKDHSIEIQNDYVRHPRPSIDLLLSSAAAAYGEHLIAVILTGAGHDGTAGAVEVKNAGGTVIIQDPQTARYPSMPRALPPNVVDFEVSIEGLGSMISDLLSGIVIAPKEEQTDDLLQHILAYVSRQTSIDFRQYKASTILRRIRRRMNATHCQTLKDYEQYLLAYHEEVNELVNAFLINVTQFFRDGEAFEFLKNEVLPPLIAQARGRDKVLRFWAAGCATGEEPYSLAMLVTDMLGAELPEWSIKLFATDLDKMSIGFARRGIYSEAMLKGLPVEYKDRFFEYADDGYRIAKTLRQMVIFGLQDLSRSAPFPRIDLVLCRNVLIYFTPELQDYILKQFAFSLNAHGYLFLGKAETVRPTQTYYELLNKQWKVYRYIGKVSSHVHLRKSHVPSLDRENKRTNHLVDPKRHAFPPSDSQAPRLELGQLLRFNESLLRFLPIGVIVIDRAYHILMANVASRRLLGLREVGHEQDFLHSVQGIPYNLTRSAIDTTFRERTTVTLAEVELDSNAGGNGRFVACSLSLIQVEPGAPDLVAICITDVTEQVQTRRLLESVQAEQIHLVQELSTTNKRLSDVNKELLDANEELQVTNEELMLTHEELQASIEEFEMTNEELQDINEELETNNEELQATNEELETTNDELRARTSELHETTIILENERMHLAEITERAPFYILLLRDSLLRVEAYNPSYGKVVERDVVLKRPLHEVFELFWEAEAGNQLLRLARQVYQKGITMTTSRLLTYLPYPGGKAREMYFIYTLVPSHDIHGTVDGVIIYALDETQQYTREKDEERERLKLILNHLPSAVMALYDAKTAELITGSNQYLSLIAELRQLSVEQIYARKWYEIELFAQSDLQENLWNEDIETRQPVRQPEVRLLYATADDERVWDYSLTPIMDKAQSNVVRFILVSASEITEQVQTRREWERLNHVKDEFLSLATHELRSPLTALQGNVEILLHVLFKSTSPLTLDEAESRRFEQVRLVLERMQQQILRMGHMITEMLDVTRMRGQVFELHLNENVDLVATVRKCVEQLPRYNHNLTINSTEEHLLMRVDEERIEQVLDNLISNAIKYSPEGTNVEVNIERQPANVVVSVRDHGNGISKEDQQHLFDRFYRAHQQEGKHVDGLGLGLYIAHEIVAQHGGRMWLESEIGVGSTFYFSLPLPTA